MKFLYEYRTSDNVKHDGVINATDREDAYSLLKKQGIKPSRFSEAPGFFNKLLGKGKRWMAIGVLAIVAVVLAVVLVRRTTSTGRAYAFDSTVRRQPIGDAEVIDRGIRTGWEFVFAGEGERFLASFAVPGVSAGLRRTSEDEILAALGRKVLIEPEDSIEVQQIKAMVEGMKDELRNFLADGGNVRQYGRRLVQRQEEEMSYYRRAKMELDRLVSARRSEKEIAALMEKYNKGLRKIGVKLLVRPDENTPLTE